MCYTAQLLNRSSATPSSSSSRPRASLASSAHDADSEDDSALDFLVRYATTDESRARFLKKLKKEARKNPYKRPSVKDMKKVNKYYAATPENVKGKALRDRLRKAAKERNVSYSDAEKDAEKVIQQGVDWNFTVAKTADVQRNTMVEWLVSRHGTLLGQSENDHEPRAFLELVLSRAKRVRSIPVTFLFYFELKADQLSDCFRPF